MSLLKLYLYVYLCADIFIYCIECSNCAGLPIRRTRCHCYNGSTGFNHPQALEPSRGWTLSSTAIVECAPVCSYVHLCAPLCTCLHQCVLMCSSLLSCAVHLYAPICSCVLPYAPLCTIVHQYTPMCTSVPLCALVCSCVLLCVSTWFVCIFFIKLCICSWYLKACYGLWCVSLPKCFCILCIVFTYGIAQCTNVHPVLCPQLRLRGQINGIFFVPSSHQFSDVLSDSKSLSSLSLASPAIRFRHHSNTIYFYKSAINF